MGKRSHNQSDVLKVRTAILVNFVRKNKVEEAYNSLRKDAFPNVPLELFKGFWKLERKATADDVSFANSLLSRLQGLQDSTRIANEAGFFWKQVKETVKVSTTEPTTAQTDVVSDKKVASK